MACVCGHAIEEHEDERGPCEGTTGKNEEPCLCVAYEEDEDDDDH